MMIFMFLRLKGIETCRIQDVSDFMKRLRALMADYYLRDGIRFYAATEYGDQTFRPHAHMILYGCPIPDLKLYDDHDRTNSTYFTSKMLDNLWRKGNVLIGEVEFESCSYVARYVTKRLPERCMMSIIQSSVLSRNLHGCPGIPELVLFSLILRFMDKSKRPLAPVGSLSAALLLIGT